MPDFAVKNFKTWSNWLVVNINSCLRYCDFFSPFIAYFRQKKKSNLKKEKQTEQSLVSKERDVKVSIRCSSNLFLHDHDHLKWYIYVGILLTSRILFLKHKTKDALCNF